MLGIIHAAHFGSYFFLVLGLLVVLATMAMWWRDVLKESKTPGLHSAVVRIGLRYGMTLFITSEVMFFVGFFWAFFHFALFPEHVLDVAGPAIWPPAGIETFNPFNLPLLNTMILLLSGCTVTWAHHALIENDRKGLIMGLGLTILLGMSFTGFQALEYSDAPFKFKRRRRLPGGLLPRDRLPRLPRDRRDDFPHRLLVPGEEMAISLPSGISGSRPRPGTGISSTWSGCSCSWPSMSGVPASRSRSSVSDWTQPSLLRVSLLCRCPRCGVASIFRWGPD